VLIVQRSYAYAYRVRGRIFGRKVQQMKKTAIWSILLALGQLNSTSRAQSQEDIAKQFAGMWRLVSNPQRLVDGTTREGSNSVGYAFFDANAGHMCFLSMNPNRPQWKSEAAPTPEEGLSAIRGFGAYCATIEIDARRVLWSGITRSIKPPTQWAERPRDGIHSKGVTGCHCGLMLRSSTDPSLTARLSGSEW